MPLPPQSTGIQVHTSGSNRGSRFGTALLVVVLAVAGWGFHGFWTDRPGLIQHVAERDGLALPAAWALARQGVPEEASGPLREALEKGDPRLRAAAAKALGTRKDRGDVPFLGDAAINDAEPSVRAAALRAIGAIGDGTAGRFVERALDDASGDVQVAACEAVAGCQLQRFIPQLIDHLKHYDANIQRAAKAALESFTGPDESYGFDPAEWSNWYQRR